MSGSSEQKTTTSNQPYGAANPLDKGMSDAMSLYKNGGWSSQTPCPRWSLMLSRRQSAWAMTDMGNANIGGNGLSGQFQASSTTRYNGDQQTALQGIRDTATSEFDPRQSRVQTGAPAGRRAMYGQNANAAALGRSGPVRLRCHGANSATSRTTWSGTSTTIGRIAARRTTAIVQCWTNCTGQPRQRLCWHAGAGRLAHAGWVHERGSDGPLSQRCAAHQQ